LSGDDVGYDGDVEVVRPDEVEEPESEPEDSPGLGMRRLLWPDTDEELATKMKRLGWRSKHRDLRNDKLLDRPGAKRLSKEADMTDLNQHGKRTEIEVSEMADGPYKGSNSKRRKENRFNVAKRIINGRQDVMQTSTSEHTDGKAVAEYESVSPAQEGGGNEMDLD
jgi:hypothetical protein